MYRTENAAWRHWNPCQIYDMIDMNVCADGTAQGFYDEEKDEKKKKDMAENWDMHVQVCLGYMMFHKTNSSRRRARARIDGTIEAKKQRAELGLEEDENGEQKLKMTRAEKERARKLNYTEGINEPMAFHWAETGFFKQAARPLIRSTSASALPKRRSFRAKSSTNG